MPIVAIDLKARGDALALQNATERLKALRAELDNLKGKGSINLTVGETNNIARLTREADALQKKLSSVGTTGVGTANSLRTSFGGLQGILGNLGLGGLASIATGAGFAAAAVGIGKLALNLGDLGAQSIVTEKSFNSVLQSIGASPAILNELNDAAGGTITQMRLMQLTNTALAGASDELGAAFANALPKLIEGARAANQLNPALGDAEFLFQSLVTGIKRGSPMLIDNTGITLKLGEANERYAASVGKTVAQLTEEEKKLALLQATMDGADRLVQQAGGSLDNLTTSSQILTSAWADLRAEMGKSLAVPVSEAKGFLADMLNTLRDNLAGYSEEAAIAMLAQRELEAETANLAGAQEMLTDAIERGDEANIAYWGSLVNSYTILRDTAQAQYDAAQAIVFGAQVSSAAIGAVAGLTGAYLDLGAAMAGAKSGSTVPSPWDFTSASARSQYATAIRPDTQAAAGQVWEKQQAAEAAKSATDLAAVNAKAAKATATAWDSAFNAVANSAKSEFSKAQDQLKNLLPDLKLGGLGMNEPGSNGPFEDIFRAADVANLGGASPWAEQIAKQLGVGMDEVQAKAKETVTAFAQGFRTPEVRKLINEAMLVDQVQQAEAAKASLDAWGKAIAQEAGVNTNLKEGGAAVMGSLFAPPAGEEGKDAQGAKAAEAALNELAKGIKTKVESKDFAGQMIGYGETIWGYTETGMINKAKSSVAFQQAIDAMVAAAIAGALQQ